MIKQCKNGKSKCVEGRKKGKLLVSWYLGNILGKASGKLKEAVRKDIYKSDPICNG